MEHEILKTWMDGSWPNRNNPKSIEENIADDPNDLYAIRTTSFVVGSLGAFVINRYFLDLTNDRTALLFGGLGMLFLGDDFNNGWQSMLYKYYHRMVDPEVVTQRYMHNREQKLGF